MIEPKFGYISNDINHLVSIPLAILMPLAVLFGLCYWFNKERKAIKEKQQSKWRLIPSVIVISLWSCFVALQGLNYVGWLLAKPVCKHFMPDIIGNYGGGSESTIEFLFLVKLDVDTSKIDPSTWPYCPEYKDAVEAYIKRHPEEADEKK